MLVTSIGQPCCVQHHYNHGRIKKYILFVNDMSKTQEENTSFLKDETPLKHC